VGGGSHREAAADLDRLGLHAVRVPQLEPEEGSYLRLIDFCITQLEV